MKKIALIGGKYNRNAGDMLILECAEYLLNEAAHKRGMELDIETVDHMGASHAPKPLEYPRRSLAGEETDARASKLKLYEKSPGMSRNLKDIKWLLKGKNKKYRAFCEKKLAGADMIVFAGGGIFKFKREGFHLRNYEIIKTAERRKIPVCFNAVGVEGYDRCYLGCRMMERVARSEAVKLIGTRDFIETLQKGYRPAARLCRTADPAVWAAKAFGVERDKASETVGVGAVRGRLFSDHGTNISESELIALYKDIIAQLDAAGQKWRLFTTGLKDDTLFALRLLDELGLSRDRLLPPPRSARELLGQIASFNSIIAGRLHACISAYSLDIPAVGLRWSDKLGYFGEAIERPRYFIAPGELNAQLLIERLSLARREGYDSAGRERYKATVRLAICDMLDIIE